GGLKDHQAKGSERRPQNRRPPAIRHQRGDRGGEREDAHDRRRRPMRPLDDRVQVVEWGNPAAVTGGPLRAAQPRARGAHHDAHYHEQEGHRHGDRSELGKSGQCVSPRRSSGRQLEPMIAVASASAVSADDQRPAQRRLAAGLPNMPRARNPKTTPLTKPPTCARYATPPLSAVETSEPNPLTNCSTAHRPMASTAGTGTRKRSRKT